MSEPRERRAKVRLTNLVVRVQTLDNAVVSLKRIAPPSMHWTEEEKACGEVEREVVIRDKCVLKQLSKRGKICEHMLIEKSGALRIHGTPSSKVNRDDKM